MIKNRFLAVVMAVLAGVSVISCDEIQEVIDKVIEVSISSDNDAFNADGEAVVKLSLNAPSNKDINVILGVSAEAQSGFSAVSSDALVFEGSVTIPAGTDLVPVTVKLNDKAKAGQQAVITIASANGASVGKDAVVYLKVPAEYSNENNPGGGDEKPNLAGADVWSIIGAFNNWAGDVELTKTGSEVWTINGVALSGEFKFRGNKEWGNYDLGAASGAQIVFGEALPLVHKGQNITIAEGVYDIVLYPTELKAVFSQVGTVGPAVLDWSLKYNGCIWVEGYYGEGQLEWFEVSNTDATKYYFPVVQDVEEDGDIEALIKADPATFFANLQDNLDYTIELYSAIYGYSREELIPELFYNEAADGVNVLQEGLEAGKYQFAVFSADSQGIFDQKYAVLSFEKTEDAASVYDWNINAFVNPEWKAEWDGWEPGEEGESFWVAGKAPGAPYVYVEAYTDEEVEEYFENGIQELFNSLQSSVKDALYQGYTMQEIVESDLIAVDSDGSFEALLDTYGEFGETNVYVVGFDASGNVIGGYGKSPVEIPEYVPEPIVFAERTDWAVAYDAAVDTGDSEYPYAVVTTACDAKYYVVEVYPEGYWEGYELDDICEDALYYVDGYGLDACLQAGFAFDSVPGVYAVGKLKNGYEAYIFGLDEYGKPTGEWHMDVMTGVVEIPAADWKERTDWAINYDASIDTGDAEYPYAVVTTVCDAPYFVTAICDSGALAAVGLNDISDEALYYVNTYGMEMCLEYDAVFTSVPAVEAWNGLRNGDEAYIFALDETGKLTGEWHMETLTGISEAVAAPSVRKAPVVKAHKLAPEKKEIKGRSLRANIKAAAKCGSVKASLKEDKPALPLKKVTR